MILFISLQWLLSLTKTLKWYAHCYMYLHTWTSLEWDFYIFCHFLRSSMSQESLSWDSSSSMRFLSIQCCLNLMMLKHIKWLRETTLSFGSIYWRSFLGCRKTTCFQINCRHPCYFHAPQKPPECLWGNRTQQSLSPSRLEGFVILTPMLSPVLSTHKTAPRSSHQGWANCCDCLQVPLVEAVVIFQLNIDDAWLFSTLLFRAFIIWGQMINHLTKWNSANVPECGFHDYKFNQPLWRFTSFPPEFLFENLFQEESLLHFTIVTQVFQERENKTIKRECQLWTHVSFLHLKKKRVSHL